MNRREPAICLDLCSHLRTLALQNHLLKNLSTKLPAPMNYSVRRVTLLAALLFPLMCADAATISWVGGSGDWNTPGNWNTGVLPGPNDDVLIENAGAITVNHASGTNTVKSIQCHESFVLSGGSLTVS